MRDFFAVVNLLVQFMKECVIEMDGFKFTLWDLTIALIWISAAIFVFKKWRDDS